ncbi:MAG: hypothetical protein HYT80_09535 [Euryarchaeota archaeon]|nr:hypothetical protein [Euryarchaeota archaeon]
MLTVISASLVTYQLGWLIKKRPTAALAAAFLLFSLFMRTAALIYLDLAGPVYSTQLERIIGGGSALPVFAAIVAAFMASLSFAFRPAALGRWRPPADDARVRGGDASTVAFVLFGFAILLLYGDLLRRQQIPLLAGIDRLQYTAVAGVLHVVSLEFGFLIAAALGYLFVRPRIRGREFDFRFLGLSLALLLYFALTGHRFSAFYSFTSFFVVPLAAIPAMAAVGKLPPAPRRSPFKAFASSPRGLTAGAFVAAAGLAWLISNSVTRVRAYEDPVAFLKQRILVQPSEFWCVTWEEIVSGVRYSFGDVWNRLFVDPIDPNRNTSIQWLMEKTLGYERASELLANGTQFAGGYPEVFFDLLGPWFAPIAIAAFLVPTVLLLRLVVRASVEGRAFTMLAGVYVYYGFTLLYIGGMLNFLSSWTYWAKVSVLVLVYVAERRQPAVEASKGTHDRSGVAGARALSGGGII